MKSAQTILASAFWLLLVSSTSSTTTTTEAAAAASVVTRDSDLLLVDPSDTIRYEQNPMDATRNLQTGRDYDIGAPVITYVGFRLTLAYTVRDQITPEMVRPLVFRDGECSRPLDEDTAAGIIIDVIPENTSGGDGSGTRTVRFFGLFFGTIIQTSVILDFGCWRFVCS
jgi:hypothetical protein